MNRATKSIIQAVREAGQAAKALYDVFDRHMIVLKAHNEYVTMADSTSEKIIIERIKQVFPRHHIISEESGENQRQSEFSWIIDPIDGTTNFTMHNPYWCVSLALAHGKKIVLGIIYAPILDEMYVAEKGKGAWRNGKKIKVSDFSQGKTLNAFCNNREPRHVERALKYFSIMKRAEKGCYQLGSAALELAYLAGGRLESMVVPGAYSWDVAAGVIMVEEAGGKVTDFQGRKWHLKSPDMLASNKKVHKPLLAIVGKL